MTALELEEYTGFLVRRAQQAHASLWFREVSTEITSVQFGALDLLQRHPGIDQRTLGEHLQLDRSTVADVSSRLQARGDIRRERDQLDRRRNILHLTSQGLDVVTELQPAARKVNDLLVENLGEHDRTELRRLLHALLDSPGISGLIAEE